MSTINEKIKTDKGQTEKMRDLLKKLKKTKDNKERAQLADEIEKLTSEMVNE